MKILVIEDCTDVREVLVELLSLEGHQVLDCKCGKDAIVQASTHMDLGLVLSDIGLPDLDGRCVAQMIHRRRPAVPIYLLTGWTSMAQAMVDGVREILVKPVTMNEILRIVIGTEISAGLRVERRKGPTRVRKQGERRQVRRRRSLDGG